ncbi:MAG: hypothetical protein Fur0035_04830 [Anaerolineales bacterium]
MTNPQILLADDDNDLLTLTRHLLESAGHTVFSAHDGAEALAVVREQRPALALLDLDMGDPDGFEVCRRIKSDPSLAETLVIILTGSRVDLESRVSGLEVGADDYIVRPIANRELLARVQAFLRIQSAARALRQSEAHWSATFDAVADAILLTDAAGVILKANRAAEEMWRSPLPLAGQKCHHILGPEKTCDFCPLFNVREIHQRQSLVFSQGGRWFEGKIDPIFDEAGGFRGAVHVISDITARKNAEDALLQNEALLKEAQRVGLLGFSEWRSGSDEVFCSEEALRLFDLPLEARRIPRQKIGERVHPQDKQRLQRLDREAFAQKSDMDYEYRLLLPGNRLRWIHQVTRVSYDQAGQPIRAMAVLQDITRLKQDEQALSEYSLRLEAKVEARTRELREAQEKMLRHQRLAALGQLAGAVGHELRNPLTVINNAVYFLKLIGADSSEKVKQYFDIIEGETRNAERIINDLLDFSRVKACDLEPVAVSRLLEQSLERFPLPSGVQLSLLAPQDLPPLYVDRRHLIQVLGNLLTNACQAMPGGGSLTISADFLPARRRIRLAVRDSGVGIPPENLPKLFEPLFTTKAKGVGLGLAVSKKLVEANGGEIEVESQPGAGATFTLFLPVQEQGA